MSMDARVRWPFELKEFERVSRARTSAGVTCGVSTVEFAIARPVVASAAAKPVFFFFGDLEVPEAADGRPGVEGVLGSLLIDKRRKSRRFLPVVTEYTEMVSELSGAESKVELGIFGTVALVARPYPAGDMRWLPALWLGLM